MSTPAKKNDVPALTQDEKDLLAECEAVIADGLKEFVRVGQALLTIQQNKLYRADYPDFDTYLSEQWHLARSTGYQKIDYYKSYELLESAFADTDVQLPDREAHVRPLRYKDPNVQKEAWEKSIKEVKNPKRITQALVKENVNEIEAEYELARQEDAQAADESAELPHIDFALKENGSKDLASKQDLFIALPIDYFERSPLLKKYGRPIGHTRTKHVYERAVPLSVFEGRPPLDEIMEAYRRQGRSWKFHRTTISVDWALHTWNPVTGCNHSCSYCYARDMAETLRRYHQGFAPTFHPGRLLAPEMHPDPKDVEHPRDKNVFTCSMADLFGLWMPDWIIESVLDAIEGSPYDFLFLTKYPIKLSNFDFPENAWVGATVDGVNSFPGKTASAFEKVEAKVKWLSCEPLLAPLDFDSLKMFDCIVLGGQSSHGKMDAVQPEWEWVEDLMTMAREDDCVIYWKDNLTVRPTELPV